MGYTDTTLGRVNAVLTYLATEHLRTDRTDLTTMSMPRIVHHLTHTLTIGEGAARDAVYAARDLAMITLEPNPEPFGDQRLRIAQLTDDGWTAIGGPVPHLTTPEDR